MQEHRCTEGPAAPESTDDLEQEALRERDAPERLLQQCRELGEYFSYYAAARADGVKLSLRNGVLWIAFAALAFVAVGGLVFGASWILLSGIAEGLGVLFGERVWAGRIVAGLLLLAGLGFGLYGTVTRWKTTSRDRTSKRYDDRQARQEGQFGRKVSERARKTHSEKE
ncbi:MAG TPA: hypothetical protein VGM03_03665 [Phycisphaerae bacterium]|jgi:hypothetical protein